MSKRLEELKPGTSVLVGEEQVGEVRGVYGIGDSLLAEYLNVFWTARNAELMVPTTDVLDIEDRGVILQGTVESYNDLSAFDVLAHPTMKRLN
ncbi:MAG: hypothetical protein M3N19_00955 [Candidatus Eremiobacteraeota bacterium]|nr:hypothetical protein [Candidatus Eremiobacteraeota bacterium]